MTGNKPGQQQKSACIFVAYNNIDMSGSSEMLVCKIQISIDKIAM